MEQGQMENQRSFILSQKFLVTTLLNCLLNHSWHLKGINTQQSLLICEECASYSLVNPKTVEDLMKDYLNKLQEESKSLRAACEKTLSALIPQQNCGLWEIISLLLKGPIMLFGVAFVLFLLTW